MKYIVPIDRASIKLNPNAGNQVYQYSLGPQPPQVSVVGQDVINGPWIERVWIGPLLVSAREVEPRKDKSLFINIQQRQEIEKMYSLNPEPKHLFEYKEIEIKCQHCEESFSNKELKDDWEDYYDDDGCRYETHVVNICPKCGVADCCEVEYEKLSSDFCIDATTAS